MIFVRNGQFEVKGSKINAELLIGKRNLFVLLCFGNDEKIVFILIKLGIYAISYFVLYPLFCEINQETTLQNAPDGDEGTTAKD